MPRIPGDEAQGQAGGNGDNGKEREVDSGRAQGHLRDAKLVTEIGHPSDKGPIPGGNTGKKEAAHEIEIGGKGPDSSLLMPEQYRD